MNKIPADRVIGLFKAPFTHINGAGAILDARNQHVADVRAWGMLQHLVNGDELQDALGQLIVESLNDRWKAEKKQLDLGDVVAYLSKKGEANLAAGLLEAVEQLTREGAKR